MSVEIRHLRQFLAVAEELHFTRAAERLHLAQPALSTQIKKLERVLQLKLLKRNTRAVELTSDGEALLVQVREAIDAYDRVFATAALLNRGGSGQLTLGINPRTRSQARVDILSELQEINPQVTVDFIAESSVRLVEAVMEGRLNAALCVAPVRTAGLRSILVRHEPCVVALGVDHPLAERSSLTLGDLRDEEWILPSQRVFGSNSILRERCLEAGFEMKVSNSTADYDDDFTAVAAGHGIEVVPNLFVRSQLAPGVKCVPLINVSIAVEFIYPLEAESPALSCLMEAVLNTHQDPNPEPEHSESDQGVRG